MIEDRSVPLRVFRADGGATSSPLVMQTQADLLGRDIEVSDVAGLSSRYGETRVADPRPRRRLAEQQRPDLPPSRECE